MLDPGAMPGGKAATSAVEEVLVPTSTVREGDMVRILPGERIPVDGEVVEGVCSVDESMLTGETRCAMPRGSGEERLRRLLLESSLLGPSPC